MRLSRLALFIFAACSAIAASTSAQQADAPRSEDIAEARRAYDEGAAAYRLGRFSEAVARFEAAYRVMKFPGMLFDLAQARRRQFETEKADAAQLELLRQTIDLYRAFLREGGANLERRRVAEQLLGKLEQDFTQRSQRRRAELIASATGAEGLFVAEQLAAEGALKDAATALDHVLGGRELDHKVFVAALAQRALLATRLGDERLAVTLFTRLLAMDAAYVVPSGAEPRTQRALALAKAALAGKAPLALSHVPVGRLVRGAPLSLRIDVRADPLDEIVELAVRFRVAGAGAFSIERGPVAAHEVQVPAVTLGSLRGGDRLEYYLAALDAAGGELVVLGSSTSPYAIAIAPRPGDDLRAVEPRAKRWYKKAWVWTLIVAGTLAAGGAATGAYFATRPDRPTVVNVPTL